MMKALLSVRAGGPETLELVELPTPEPGPGEIRMRTHACAINYPDVLTIEDKYQFRPPRPFSPGCEVSGEVEAVGPGVTGWTAGDRLLAVARYGGLAEQMIVPATSAIPVPRHLDLLEGAALIFTYATTLHALTDRGNLQAGETMLVLGASGGIGLSAIELGKVMGATVVAAVSSEAKASAAKEAGADRVMIYERGPFNQDGAKALASAFKSAVGPGGADVIYDPVGGEYAEPALRSIGWGGRYLVVGFPAGIPLLPLNLTLLKACDVRGVFWGAFAEREPKAHRKHLAQLIAWWESGRIRPRIDQVFSLAEGGKAIARLASRSAIGKVVVQMTST